MHHPVSYTHLNLQTSPAAECSLQYRVFGDGRIQTTLHYDPVEGLAAMPEFGVLFKIDADYDTVEWYGNGPAETYWDRQHGAKLGIYQNKVADNMAQYLVPQECGAKTAVRWAKVVDRKGRGLLFTADAAKPMFFSALPYTCLLYTSQLKITDKPVRTDMQRFCVIVHTDLCIIILVKVGNGGFDFFGDACSCFLAFLLLPAY